MFARSSITRAAPLLMLGLGLFVMLLDPGGLASQLRGALFDNFQAHDAPNRALAGHDAGHPFGILRIDSESMVRNGPWPWDGAAQAELTEALSRAGVRLVVFTTPLFRADASPANLAASLPQNGRFDTVRGALAGQASSDDKFAAALRGMPAVLPVLLGPQGGRTFGSAARLEYRGRHAPFATAPSFEDGVGPVPALAAAAAGVAAINLIPERDGVVRRMPTVFQLHGLLLPAVTAEAARLVTGARALTFDSDEGDPFALHLGTALAGMEIGGRQIATGGDGLFWINYADAIAHVEVSASSVLAGDATSRELAGMVLFVDAPGDKVATPFGLQDPAYVLEKGFANLMSGHVLERPSFALPGEICALLVTGTIMIILMLRLGIVAAGLFAACILAGWFYGAWFAFTTRHWLMDAATPGAALATMFAAGALTRLRAVQMKRSELRQAFSDSLPASTIEKIAHRPDLLRVAGETRTITYLVCGVRGLLEMASAYENDPKGFTQLMQQMLSPLLDQVLAHGGTIDRLTADGFAAFWNAPLDDPDHAIHACEAAHGMSVTASRIGDTLAAQQAWTEGLSPPMAIGIGIATGPAIAGGFGGHERLGYSVNGRAVALAARIQALSSQYGPAIIVADEVQKQAERSFAFLEVDTIAAGAADTPVRLYAMLGNPIVRASPKFRALTTFHDHIFNALRRQQWGKARELIAQCRKLSGASQTLYDLHLTRIAYFEANPPSPNWDGAFRPILK